MAYRTYTDAHGTSWDVWDVVPDASRPLVARVGVTSGMGNGWLAFQSRSGTWRLTPRPDRWSELSDEQLEALRLLATPVKPTRR